MHPIDLLLDGRPLAEAPPLLEGQAAELSAVPPPGATLELAVNGAPIEPFLRPGDRSWRWRWVAPGAAGDFPVLLSVRWPDGASTQQRAVLAVQPRKLDLDAYAALLDDLQRLGRALALALGGGAAPARTPAELDLSPPTLAEELHGTFGSELARLAGAVARLARRPPDRLRSGVEEQPLGQLQDAAKLLELRPAQETATLRSSTPSYDSYEARLLRRLLETLWRRLERLAAQPALPPEAVERIVAARAQLRALRAAPFLAEVPPLTAFRGPTPRMQRDPEYRLVFNAWRQLRRRPLLSWDAATLSLPLADLPRLYERWCAASVALALLELPGLALRAQALLVDDDEAQLLALPEERPLVVLAAPDGAELRLRYQPRYRPSGAPLRSLDRHTRVPDLALEIVRPGEAPRVAVLDAKYRLDATGGVPEEALADAYSYLGSIGHPDGGRATLGVALLYPGRGSAESYPSGVAALPLLPGNAVALRAWLSGLL
jgi:large subunit ribosomal protein MRP49